MNAIPITVYVKLLASTIAFDESGGKVILDIIRCSHKQLRISAVEPVSYAEPKKVNVTDTYYIMNTKSFLSWVQHRQQRPDSNISQADKLVPLLKQAGPTGMSRRQLAGAIDLPPSLVDGLLAALLDTGQIRIDVAGGIRTYRA